jgi:hypothetical protein
MDKSKPAKKPARRPMAAPKAFDVFRPGKTPTSSTSRPLIVGHKPKVQDSTLTDKPSKIVSVSSGKSLMDPQDKVTVAPPNPTAEDTANSTPVTLEAPAPQQPEEPAAAGTAEAPAPPEMPGAEPEPVEALAPSSQKDAPATETPQPPADQPAEAQSSSLPPELNKLSPDDDLDEQPPADPAAAAFDPAQIVVSHHGSDGRWLRRLLILLLILVLIVAAADALLDAGTLHPNANIPHTHFIKQSSPA